MGCTGNREERQVPTRAVCTSAVLAGTVCAFTEPENTAQIPQRQACSSDQMFVYTFDLQLKHELCLNSTA